MTVIGTATVELDGDTKGFDNALVSAQKELKGLGRKLRTQFTTVTNSAITLSGALKLLGGVTAFGFAANQIFKIGAAVDETASKFRTVFGPATADAQRFITEFANVAGLTETAARDLLATTGSIVQGMGASQAASAEFAEEIVRLSGDFASFNNIPIAETSRAVQAALTGERESLKRLGIVINEADVQRRAFTQTGKDSAKELTALEKATATLSLIQERAGVAVGDLERTMDSQANVANRLRAEFGDLVDGLATGLSPAFGVILGDLAKMTGSEGFSGLGTELQARATQIAAWTRFAIEAFKGVFTAVGAIVGSFFDLGQAIGNVLTAFAQFSTGNLFGAIDTLREAGSEMVQIKDRFAGVIDQFGEMQFAAGSALQTLKTDTKEATDEADALAAAAGDVGAAFEEVAEAGAEAFSPVVTDIDKAIDRIGKLEAEISEIEFEIGFAKTSEEVDVLTNKLDNLQGDLVALEAATDGFVDAYLAANEVEFRPAIDLPPLSRTFEELTEQGRRFNGALARGAEFTNTLKNAFAGVKKEVSEAFDLTTILSNALGDLASTGLSFLVSKLSEALGDIIGAIGGLLGFGEQGSPARALAIANMEAMERNRQAIDRNTEALAQAAGQAPGGLAGPIGGVLAQLFAELAAAQEGDVDGRGVAFPFQQRLQEIMEQFGVSMFDVRLLTDALGLEFVNSTSFFRQLNDILSASVTDFDSFRSNLSLLQDKFSLLDFEPQQQFDAIIDLLAGFVDEDFADVLKGLDASNFDEFLEGFLDGLADGTFALEQLGDVSRNEFLDALRLLEASLDQVSATASDASQSLITIADVPIAGGEPMIAARGIEIAEEQNDTLREGFLLLIERMGAVEGAVRDNTRSTKGALEEIEVGRRI